MKRLIFVFGFAFTSYAAQARFESQEGVSNYVPGIVFATHAIDRTFFGLAPWGHYDGTLGIYTKNAILGYKGVYFTKLYRGDPKQLTANLRLTDEAGHEVQKTRLGEKAEMPLAPTTLNAWTLRKYHGLSQPDELPYPCGRIDLRDYFVIERPGTYTFSMGLLLWRRLVGNNLTPVTAPPVTIKVTIQPSALNSSVRANAANRPMVTLAGILLMAFTIFLLGLMYSYLRGPRKSTVKNLPKMGSGRES